MDIVSIAIFLGIAMFVLVEYQRRERDHQRALIALGRGEKPEKPVPIIPLWKVLATGCVLVILLVATGFLASLTLRAHPRSAPPLMIITGGGVVLVVAVTLMFAKSMAGRRRADAVRRRGGR
jgi:hypothetical protein